MKKYVINQFEIKVTDKQEKEIDQLQECVITCEPHQREIAHQLYMSYIYSLYEKAMKAGKVKRVDRIYVIHHNYEQGYFDPTKR